MFKSLAELILEKYNSSWGKPSELHLGTPRGISFFPKITLTITF